MTDSIATVLDESCVQLELTARRKPDIIRELVEVLARANRISDADEVTRRVLEREELTTTGIGGGIAIPHCLSVSASETVLAFGRKSSGAKFDAVDKQPVLLFFLMVGPPGAHNEHLRLLSKLARYLHDPGLKESLLSATTPEQVVDLFRGREG
ncbi:MAG: PTS sugar transporter subunit IIA [Spirochaetota bacterium]